MSRVVTVGRSRGRMKAYERVALKLRKNRASILNEREVRLLEGLARRMMGPDYVALFADKGVSFNKIIRLSSLRARCRQARNERGIDIRAVSIATGIPQYRLRAIEEGSMSEIRPEFAARYFDFLKIRSWVQRWARANPDLAPSIGIRVLQVRRRSRSRSEWEAI